ncbi:MAG: hypothetical protein HW406_133 [Candidatus Brocadiaceae bacterium]|nr:hypothetical protein [Candidatus Brocadiaceae bacterium]
MKKMIDGLSVAFVLLVPISGKAFAYDGKRPIFLSEPFGYLLIAAGGAVLVGIRHWMIKRRCKKDTNATPTALNMNRCVQ